MQATSAAGLMDLRMHRRPLACDTERVALLCRVLYEMRSICKACIGFMGSRQIPLEHSSLSRNGRMMPLDATGTTPILLSSLPNHGSVEASYRRFSRVTCADEPGSVFILVDLAWHGTRRKPRSRVSIRCRENNHWMKLAERGSDPPHADMGGLHQRAGSILILHFTLTTLLLLLESYLLFE